jgi:hypothetical protein
MNYTALGSRPAGLGARLSVDWLWTGWCLAVTMAVLAAAILLLRRPDALLRPQFKAEDGVIFFNDAYEQGPGCLLAPYAGYLHTVPRIVACLAMAFDPAWAPAFYALASLLVQLSVIAVLFSPRVDLPAKPWLALALVLAPHTGEVFVNLTNAQWPLAMVLVLMLIARDPDTPGQSLADMLTVTLSGLTGPFIVFLMPLFAGRAMKRRSVASVLLALLAGLIAGVQLAFLARERAALVLQGSADPWRFLGILSARLYGTFFGGYGIPHFTATLGWVVLGGAITAVLAWRAFRPGPWAGARRLLAGAWVCLVVPVGIKFFRDAEIISYPVNGDRYFYLPHVLLAWMIVLECARAKGSWRILAAVPLVVALAANLPSFRAAPLTDYAWPRQVQAIREGRAFAIPINPVGWMMVSRGRNCRR